MVWFFGILGYLIIGITLAFTLPYSGDVPFVDKVKIIIGWLPVFLYFLIKEAFSRF